ncbi:MAG: cheA1 [Polyangiaceae bacterium]|jgi:signal transduction histidine kinase|nr:cheA1 [Polyangiaceae bacterium]
MKLTLRFVLLVAALLLAVAASATAGWSALGRLDAALDGVVKSDMERLLAITHSRRLFRSMVVLERDYLLSTSAQERQGMDKKQGTAAKELLEQIEKYAKLMPSADRQAVADIRGARERWLLLNTRVRNAAKAGEPNAVPLSTEHAKDPVSWEGVIGKLVKANEQRLGEQVKKTHATYENARRTLLGVSVAAALLAAGFGTVIFLGIRRTMREVTDLNQNLEGLVKVRTQALAERERSLRLVLDSTGDGIIGVRGDGMLAGDSSAAAARWFGEARAGVSAAAYFFPTDEDRQAAFEMGLEQLFSDVFPWDAAVEQLPRRIEREGLFLELSYRQVANDTSDVSLLVLVRDVTERVQSERAEQDAREQQTLVAKLLSDKQGFSAFVADAERLIQSFDAETDSITVKRNLHTLKGNVAIYGLASVARACHAVEDRMAESGDLPDAVDVAALAGLFRAKLTSIETFLSSLDESVFEVKSDEHAALVSSLMERKDYQEILRMVEVWTWSRTAEHLTRLRGQVEHVAKRLGKAVKVEVEHNDLRLPATYLQSFWPTLVHVVRNAVDHGIEDARLRGERGKPAEGHITLRTWQTDTQICIEVADDGGGIDVEAVREKALANGLELPPESQLAELVLADGFSTRSDVTDLSGRGVGLSATAEACRAEGGRLEIHNDIGLGVRFVFRFRRPVVKTGALAAKLERRWSLSPAKASA